MCTCNPIRVVKSLRVWSLTGLPRHSQNNDDGDQGEGVSDFRFRGRLRVDPRPGDRI